MIRHTLAVIAIALSTSACVSSSKYDAAVQSANDARADAQRNDARARDLDMHVAKLHKALDDATAEDAQLRAELERLGKNSDALLAEKGTLAASLNESKVR